MRERFKACARGLANIVVAPSLVSFWFRSKLMGRDRALQGSTQRLARVPGIRGEYLRRAFLSHAIAACHPTATICYGTIFSSARASIDAFVYVGARCHLGFVHLERDVLLGDGIQVPSGAHVHGIDDPLVPIREQTGQLEEVRIGEGTWIGGGSIVLADIGRHSVVGAGSVVTKPLPDFVVAAGVPARIIRTREPASSGTN